VRKAVGTLPSFDVKVTELQHSQELSVFFMSARDVFHETVKEALRKDGWVAITPLTLKYGNTRLEVDLSAERLLVVEKENLKIAVEVKSFLSSSVVYEFHQAVGQYLHYRLVLARTQSLRISYLAMPKIVYTRHFGDDFFQDSIQIHEINLIDIDRQEIDQWLPPPSP
jgi:XisH protein